LLLAVPFLAELLSGRLSAMSLSAESRLFRAGFLI